MTRVIKWKAPKDSRIYLFRNVLNLLKLCSNVPDAELHEQRDGPSYLEKEDHARCRSIIEAHEN